VQDRVSVIHPGAAMALTLTASDLLGGRLFMCRPNSSMFKIAAVFSMGILAGIGFFDLRREAYTMAALLLLIAALLDYGRKKPTA
jgi:hypothetical protein